jgi:hypothetical protein
MSFARYTHGGFPVDAHQAATLVHGGMTFFVEFIAHKEAARMHPDVARWAVLVANGSSGAGMVLTKGERWSGKLRGELYQATTRAEIEAMVQAVLGTFESDAISWRYAEFVAGVLAANTGERPLTGRQIFVLQHAHGLAAQKVAQALERMGRR